MLHFTVLLLLVGCDSWWPGQESVGKKGPKPKTTVKVYFADRTKFEAGADDVLTAVERDVGEKANYRNTLKALFKGPRALEREQGLQLLNSGADGFNEFALDDGVATLKLRGGCDGGGGDVTVFDLIAATLKEFDDIHTVKLLDPEGNTENPDGPGDSRPACLLPKPPADAEAAPESGAAEEEATPAGGAAPEGDATPEGEASPADGAEEPPSEGEAPAE